MKQALESARDISLRAGEKFYPMERPCREGHLSKRYTSTGQCVDCHAGRSAKYSGRRSDPAFVDIKLRVHIDDARMLVDLADAMTAARQPGTKARLEPAIYGMYNDNDTRQIKVFVGDEFIYNPDNGIPICTVAAALESNKINIWK